MATWHHWGCCWVLWCGCVPLGPEGWGEGRWGTAGSGGRRGGFESCVVKKQTEELCLWLWQAPCMGWWMCEGVAGRGTDSHTLTKWWGKNNHPRTHSYTCGFTCTRPTTEQKGQLLKVTSHAGKSEGSQTAPAALTWNLQRSGWKGWGSVGRYGNEAP